MPIENEEDWQSGDEEEREDASTISRAVDVIETHFI